MVTQDEIDARNSTSPYWIEINAKADLYRSILVDVLGIYSYLGKMWGQGLLLHSHDALLLVDALEALGIAILGFDCWYRDTKDNGLREDTSVDFYVGDDISWGPNPVNDSATKVRDFIQNHLPENTQYVEFTLYIPLDWKLFPR